MDSWWTTPGLRQLGPEWYFLKIKEVNFYGKIYNW